MTETPGAGSKLRIESNAPQLRGYDVVVRAGALDDLAAHVAAAAPAARFALVVPDDIVTLYGDRALTSLRGAGLAAELIVVAAGERNKTRAAWAALSDRMLDLGFGRDSAVIALGGGVTGDLAGFAAATYMRGVPLVQVPTTLLAMIDAAVGGKTGVDTAAGKNLIGAFHPPRLVLADPLVLRTLSPAELRSGLAEAVKHGAILDAAYFEWVEDGARRLLDLDMAALEQLISRSVQLKAAVVRDDPFEQGRRAILNFGHTVGHAIELDADFSLPHGFAVAMGMVVEAAAGELCGVTERGTSGRLADALRSCDLPVKPQVASRERLTAAMRLDKKARGGTPRLALLERIGNCATTRAGDWTHEVPAPTLAAALDSAADHDE
jgi:3-dehydroquinate synthase